MERSSNIQVASYMKNALSRSRLLIVDAYKVCLCLLCATLGFTSYLHSETYYKLADTSVSTDVSRRDSSNRINEYPYIAITNTVQFAGLDQITNTNYRLLTRSNVADNRCAGFELKKCVLTAKLSMCNDMNEYVGGSNTVYDIKVKLKICYSSNCDNNTPILYTDYLHIKMDASSGSKELKPECVYVKVFDPLIDENEYNAFKDAVSFKVEIEDVVVSSVLPLLLHSNLKVDVSYSDQYVTDATSVSGNGAVPLLGIERVRNHVTQSGNPTTLVWRSSESLCVDEYPAYQLQILRLYNKKPEYKLQWQCSTTVDWNNALTFETGYLKPDAQGNYSVQVTLAEGVGYYIWRVRPIGNKYKGGIADARNFGVWSDSPAPNQVLDWDYASATMLSIAAASPNPTFTTSCAFFYKQYDISRNWQFSRSFTEDCKRLETMQYVTSSGMARQTQVRLNDASAVLVDQTVQDFSGRNALKSLPVPLNPDPLGRGGVFGYAPQMLLSPSGLYTAASFDAEKISNPEPVVQGPVKSYYSGTNAGDGARIAGAGGYPFFETRFITDGSSRPSEVAAPGPVHRIGSTVSGESRTVTSLYAAPSEHELVCMFGEEAPNPNSVQKVVTIDQNKTATVEYKMGKKVIATCLQVVNPANSNLDPIDEDAGITTQIVDPIGPSVIIGEELRTQKRIAIVVPTEITVNGSFTPGVFSYKQSGDAVGSCIDLCATCGYIYTLSIKSVEYPSETEDDRNHTESHVLMPQVKDLHESANSCSTSTVTTFEYKKVLPQGTYIIERRIVPNTVSSIDEVRNLVKLRFAELNADVFIDPIPGGSGTLNDAFVLLEDGNILGFYNALGKSEEFVKAHDGQNIDLIYPSKCVSIKVPVVFPPCAQSYTTACGNPPSFGEYLLYSSPGNNRFAAPYPTTISGWFSREYEPSNQIVLYSDLTSLNSMILNMVSDGYDCGAMFKCWSDVINKLHSSYKRSVYEQTSEGVYKEVDNETTFWSPNEVLDSFLDCAGKKFSTITENISTYVQNPHKTVLFPAASGDLNVSFDTGVPQTDKLRCQTCIDNMTNTTPGSIHDVVALTDWLNSHQQERADVLERLDRCFRTRSAVASNEEEYGNEISSILSCSGDCNQKVLCAQNAFQTRVKKFQDFCAQREHQFVEIAKKALNDLHSTEADYSETHPEQVWCIVNPLIEKCKSYANFTVECNNGSLVFTPPTPLWYENLNKIIQYDPIVKVLPSSTDLCGQSDGDKVAAIPSSLSQAVTALNANLEKERGILNILHSRYGTTSKKINVSSILRSYGIGASDTREVNIVLWWEDSYAHFELKNENGQCKIYYLSKVKKIQDASGTHPLVNELNRTIGRLWTHFITNSEPLWTDSSTSTVCLGGDKPPGYLDALRLRAMSSNTYLSDACDILGENRYEYINALSDPIRTDALIKVGMGKYVLSLDTSEYHINPLQHAFDINVKVLAQDDSTFVDFITLDTIIASCKPVQIGDQVYEVQDVISGVYHIGARDSSGYDLPFSFPAFTDTNGISTWSGLYSSSSHMPGNFSVSRFEQDYDGFLSFRPDPFNEVGDSSKHIRVESVFLGLGPSNVPLGQGTDPYRQQLVAEMSTCGSDCPAFCVKWIAREVIAKESEKEIKSIPCRIVVANDIRSRVMANVQASIVEQQDNAIAELINGCRVSDQLDATLAASYPVSYKHFTLYYYDRSGNMIATNPPKAYYQFPASRSISRLNYGTRCAYNSLGMLLKSIAIDENKITRYLYNSKNQLRATFTPGVEYEPKENGNETGEYAYVKYDFLGRLVETGKAKRELSVPPPAVGSPFEPIYLSDLNELFYPQSETSEIASTVYSTGMNKTYINRVVISTVNPEDAQCNLHNRISSTARQGGIISYYSYDSQGRIKWVKHDLDGFGCIVDGQSLSLSNDVKYDYDVLTGNATGITYNEGRQDRYYYKYDYDGDCRLSEASSSRDTVVWEKDAAFSYFLHGPLKRRVLGADRVQGLDYTYTLQGWLKAINTVTSIENGPSADPGRDGGFDQANRSVAIDAYGLMLDYFPDDHNAAFNSFPKNDGGNGLLLKGLYDGNIRSMSSIYLNSTDKTPGTSHLAYPHRTLDYFNYDRIGRVTSSRVGLDPGMTDYWSTIDDYASTYSYDPNGNIVSLTRNDVRAFPSPVTVPMDNLTYNYQSNLNNKLTKIGDAVVNPSVNEDLKDQNSGNYRYDEAGHLTWDATMMADVQRPMALRGYNIEYDRDGRLRTQYQNWFESRGSSVVKWEATTHYIYDVYGNKIHEVREETNYTEQPLSGLDLSCSTAPYVTKTFHRFYVYDAASKLLAEYEKNDCMPVGPPANWQGEKGDLVLKEWFLYGQKREGTALPEPVKAKITNQIVLPSSVHSRIGLLKRYELSDYQNNVRLIVNDIKEPEDIASLNSTYYPFIINASNYYPFGMVRREKQEAAGANQYAYAYQGMEKDDWFRHDKPSAHYTTLFRQYDPRVCRWMSQDPRPVASTSGYVGMANNPILNTDPYGDTVQVRMKEGIAAFFESVGHFFGLNSISTLNYHQGGFYDHAGNQYTGVLNTQQSRILGALQDAEKSQTMRNVLTDMYNSEHNVLVVLSSGPNKYEADNEKLAAEGKSGSSGTIYFNPSSTERVATISGGVVSIGSADPMMLFFHELWHGRDAQHGYLHDGAGPSIIPTLQNLGVTQWPNIGEYQAMYGENMVRSERGLPLRAFYSIYNIGGVDYPAHSQTFDPKTSLPVLDWQGLKPNYPKPYPFK